MYKIRLPPLKRFPSFQDGRNFDLELGCFTFDNTIFIFDFATVKKNYYSFLSIDSIKNLELGCFTFDNTIFILDFATVKKNYYESRNAQLQKVVLFCRLTP